MSRTKSRTPGRLSSTSRSGSRSPSCRAFFGTADLIAQILVIGDWKFGVGEKVLAWYDVGEGAGAPNGQLMFYLLGATHTYPHTFKLEDPNWPIDIFIGQPRHRDGPNFDVATVFMKDVRAFQRALIEAAELAKSDNPPMAKGEHCRFMPCKSICPLHTGPLLDVPELAGLMGKMQFEEQSAAVRGAKWPPPTGGTPTA